MKVKMSNRKLDLGLVPLAKLKNMFNPKGVANAYAKADNASVMPFERNADGDVVGIGAGAFGSSGKSGRKYFSGYDVPAMNLLQQAFGTYTDNQEIVTKIRWSETTYVDNTTTSLQPFSTKQSGVAGNQEQGGVIPNLLHFIIRAFQFYVEEATSFQTTAAVATVVNDIFSLINNGFLQFSVINKEYLRLPLYMLPSGIGISGSLATADTTTHGTWALASHGIPDPRAIFVMTNPLLLLEQTNFDVNLVWEAAQDISGNQVLSTIMNGQEVQPVQ